MLDRHTSQALTRYLRRHRLPLVGAQVLRNRRGDLRIVLYGFVASEMGRRDAARRARAYLKSKDDLPVENRVVVRPEIARMRTESAGGRPAAAVGNQSLDQVLDAIERYGVSLAPNQPGPPP